MSLLVDQKVFWLEVAVSYVHSVEILESKENFAGKEQSNVIRESSFSPQQGEQLTTACVVQKHVDMGRCLEVAFQINNEWMVNDGENFFLTLDVVYLLEFNDCALL